MTALFLENCRYVLRSRMVLFVLVFSSIIHYSGMKFLNHVTLSIQGAVSILGPKEAVYTALIFQIFTSLCIAAVYGIWMAPYAYRGERGVLTHVLPISKINFPICYLLCCGLLLLINQLVMIGSYAGVFGFAAVLKPEFPWWFLGKTFLFQLLCLEVVMSGLAVSSLFFGQVATFFIGGTFIFVLQILGAIASVFSGKPGQEVYSSTGILFLIYKNLPPVGEFLMDIKKLITGETVSEQHWLLWFVWLLIFNGLFFMKTKYPTQERSTEA